MIRGVDISYWQSNVNFDKMKTAGAEFAILRAYFSASKDQRFDEYYTGAGSAGILRGMYQFVDYRQSGETQAALVANLYNAKPTEIQPCCDLETYSAFGTYDRTKALAFLEPYVARIMASTMRKTLLYINLSTAQMLAPLPGWLVANCDLWIAHWTTASNPAIGPFSRWEMWQYTSKGTGTDYGVSSGNIDLDYYNGTLDDLRRWCGLNTTPEPPTPGDYEARIVAIEAQIAAHTTVLNSQGDKLQDVIDWIRKGEAI